MNPQSSVQEFNTALDQGVCRPVRILVPAVCCANLDVGHDALDLVDAIEQCWCCKGASVKGFRANSDGRDLVGVLGGVGLDSVLVGVERGIYVRPDVADQPSAAAGIAHGAYQTPSTTSNPLLFAAGRSCWAALQSLAEYVRTTLLPVVAEMASRSAS